MPSAILFVMSWLVVFILQILNGNDARLVAAVLAVAALGAVAAAVLAGRPGGAKVSPRMWRLGLLFLASLHLGYAGVQLKRAHVIDIATTTLEAGAVVKAGLNPYSADIDRAAVALLAGSNDKIDAERFKGYKYLPVMVAAYMPLGLGFGASGLVATNFLLMGLLLAGIYRLGLEMGGGKDAGRWAVLLFAALPLPLFQVYSKGVTDLVPVLPLVVALAILRLRPGLAGFLIGLSIAAKLMPGLLLAPLFLPPSSRSKGIGPRWRYILGGLAGILPVLPYLLGAPKEFVDNVLIFNMLRPIDPTSWLYLMPGWLPGPLHIAFGLSWLGLAAAYWFRPVSIRWRATGACVVIILMILAGPAMHENYMLWWLPFFAVLVGQLLGRRGVEDQPATVEGLQHESLHRPAIEG